MLAKITKFILSLHFRQIILVLPTLGECVEKVTVIHHLTGIGVAPSDEPLWRVYRIP